LVSGYLFDAYPKNDKMVIWIKAENGKTIRLEDSWTHSIYVAADGKEDLKSLAQNEAIKHYAKNSEFVLRYEKITDHDMRRVLKLDLADSQKAIALGNAIEGINYDAFRLYNVDVLPPQAYFYEHDLFPLAKCKVTESKGSLKWQVDDDLQATDYEVPDFKIIHLDAKHRQEARLPRFTDKLDSISIKFANQDIEIRNESEAEALDNLVREIAVLDPDFVFTADGDESVFPYLVERSMINQMQLVLSRESMPVESQKGGITYFSYGKVMYRPSTIMLHGRVHFDTHNSFIFDHSSLHGLYELARLCRMPLHTTSRATIGRCLSSMQFYCAFKKKLLVPWKPVNTEKWKSYHELFVADRGGLIFEPVVGVHENVGEFDFAALYPSIMRKRNVSGETVNCDCCPGSKNIVKELGYHICERKRGIVSEALELPLDKRAKYKKLKKMFPKGLKFQTYETRQGALKWIGVVSFGYLGHANSKFGLIDSHIVVCAIDREVLLLARNVAEDRGFNNLHGIVDSLWVQRMGASKEEYANLKEPIEQATGYDISFEGIYKWIAFLPSKNNPLVPVVNRYFGCFEDGNIIKDRGIETRRHDTPALFSRFQMEALQIMAKGNNIKEVKALMPKVWDLYQKYKQMLQEGRVALVDLIFTKNLSKDSAQYSVNTAETSAIYQLMEEGKMMQGGQTLQYVITDYYRKNSRKRTTPVDLINDKTIYDSRRYIELLAETCNSVTVPFGCKLKPNDGEAMQLV